MTEKERHMVLFFCRNGKVEKYIYKK